MKNYNNKIALKRPNSLSFHVLSFFLFADCELNILNTFGGIRIGILHGIRYTVRTVDIHSKYFVYFVLKDLHRISLEANQVEEKKKSAAFRDIRITRTKQKSIGVQ